MLCAAAIRNELANPAIADTMIATEGLAWTYTVDYAEVDDESGPGWYAYILAAPGTLPVGSFGPYDTAQEAADAAKDDAIEWRMQNPETWL